MKFINFVFFLTIQFLNAQSSFSGLSLHTGISYQTTLTTLPRVNPFLMPFDSERSIQGLGVDLGLNYQFKKIPISLTYFTRFRYDYLHHERTDIWNSAGWYDYKEKYGLIIDQHLQIKYHFSKKKNHYVGLSYTFHNPTGNYYIKPFDSNNYFNFKTNFNSIGLVTGQNIYKNLFLEEKVGFVKQFQELKDLNAFYFSLSLKYNFPVKISLAPKVN